jgi:hypothetical protein
MIYSEQIAQPMVKMIIDRGITVTAPAISRSLGVSSVFLSQVNMGWHFFVVSIVEIKVEIKFLDT